ncbi:MAG: hypothetical protein RL026_1317 [Pseudomonadota bacterium]|jgi:ubiquinone biosynthesis protein UbiJ
MLLAGVESVLERGIQASPRAQSLVAALQASPLRVEPAHLPWQLVVQARSGGLALALEAAGEAATDSRGAPHVIVRGTPLKLLALAGSSAEAVIRRGDVSIDGDAEAAQQWRELAALLRPDLEELLSRVVGDIPAYHAGRFARGALDWVAGAVRTAGDNLGEYFAHETRTLLTRTEAQGFLDEVDQLRERVDRLQARLDALAAQAPQGAAS